MLHSLIAIVTQKKLVEVLTLIKCWNYRMVFLKTIWIIVYFKKTHGNYVNQCGILDQD